MAVQIITIAHLEHATITPALHVMPMHNVEPIPVSMKIVERTVSTIAIVLMAFVYQESVLMGANTIATAQEEKSASMANVQATVHHPPHSQPLTVHSPLHQAVEAVKTILIVL